MGQLVTTLGLLVLLPGLPSAGEGGGGGAALTVAWPLVGLAGVAVAALITLVYRWRSQR